MAWGVKDMDITMLVVIGGLPGAGIIWNRMVEMIRQENM
jgi:hypothetical protein